MEDSGLAGLKLGSNLVGTVIVDIPRSTVACIIGVIELDGIVVWTIV